MISLHTLQTVADKCIAAVNLKIDGDKINAEAILCPDEKMAVKRLKDTQGIVMMCRFPQTETTILYRDNFSEENQMLIYIIETWSDGRFTIKEETTRFDYLQSLMKEAKIYLMDHFTELRAEIEKSFRTEFEYQQFGNWNGISISFSLKDYEL